MDRFFIRLIESTVRTVISCNLARNRQISLFSHRHIDICSCSLEISSELTLSLDLADASECFEHIHAVLNSLVQDALKPLTLRMQANSSNAFMRL